MTEEYVGFFLTFIKHLFHIAYVCQDTSVLVLVLQSTYCATLISEPLSHIIHKIIEPGEEQIFTNGCFVTLVGMDVYDYNFILNL